MSFERCCEASSNAHQLRNVLMKLPSAGSGRLDTHIKADSYLTSDTRPYVCMVFVAGSPQTPNTMKRAAIIVAFALLASCAGMHSYRSYVLLSR